MLTYYCIQSFCSSRIQILKTDVSLNFSPIIVVPLTEQCKSKTMWCSHNWQSGIEEAEKVPLIVLERDILFAEINKEG